MITYRKKCLVVFILNIMALGGIIEILINTILYNKLIFTTFTLVILFILTFKHALACTTIFIAELLMTKQH